MLEPLSSSATAVRATKGGQTTFCVPSMDSREDFISATSFLASWTLVFIFQLPAMIGVVGMSHDLRL